MFCCIVLKFLNFEIFQFNVCGAQVLRDENGKCYNCHLLINFQNLKRFYHFSSIERCQYRICCIFLKILNLEKLSPETCAQEVRGENEKCCNFVIC